MDFTDSLTALVLRSKSIKFYTKVPFMTKVNPKERSHTKMEFKG